MNNVKEKVVKVNASVGEAIDAAKLGNIIRRTNWNGKGMFVYFVEPGAYPAKSQAAKAIWGNTPVPYNGYLALRGVDGNVNTWAPSGSDALATDWEIIDVEVIETPVSEDTPMAIKVKPAMVQHIGVKLVSLYPMTRGEYNDYRGWKIPPDEKADDAGYLVEYSIVNGDQPNHPNHAGYISWSPKAAADLAYQQVAPDAFVNAGIDVGEPHLRRVVVEEALVATSLDKLSAFIKSQFFETQVPKEEQERLFVQLTSMQAYAAILKERLNASVVK